MQVFNFGSRHAGLESEIPAMVEELRNPARIRAAFPTLDTAAVLRRLDELPYFVLVGPGVLTSTQRVFNCVAGREFPQDDPLLSLLCRAENAPERDDNEPCDHEQRSESNGFDVDFPPQGENESRRVASNSAGTLGERPRWAGGTTGVGEIVIDYLGMYLPSLRAWLAKMRCALPGTVAHLTAGLADGPAVVICPENLADQPEMIMQSAALHLRRSLSPACNLARMLLKLTLYHEIGHHVFPVRNPGGDSPPADRSYLAEALANWFVYCVADEQERAVMLEESSNQAREYRAYRGLVWLEHAATDIVVATGMDGPQWVAAIEEAAFRRQLLGPVIDDELDRRAGDYIGGLQHLIFELEGLRHRGQMSWDRFLCRFPLPANHESRAYSLILMRCAAPRHAARLQSLAHQLQRFGPNARPWAGAPISRARQRAWLDRAAEFPRRLLG